jgi:NTP pyrophosphatase (non-canonical NTP hydrolase)
MDLNSYQAIAQQTDKVPSRGGATVGTDLIIPLLGLAGETGELLSEYKKQLRDGDSHKLFRERVAEELGDLLWYVANVASKFDLTLQEIADSNLAKTQDRWGKADSSHINFDEGYKAEESFPRNFEVELREVTVIGAIKIRAFVDGQKMGADLDDNAYDPDGYRFHDVFHLAYVAVLGWSPVVRDLLKRKRRSDDKVDNVEDGGRAKVVDEGISALVFDYARVHGWLEHGPDLDYQLLRTIKGMTSRLEVKQRSMAEWQRAILLGFTVWREVLANNGGRIMVNLDERSMRYLGPPTPEVSTP